MGITIKAKSVKVKCSTQTIKHVVRSYTCPSCHVNFRGDVGINDNTVRFKCRCGQELICSYD